MSHRRIKILKRPSKQCCIMICALADDSLTLPGSSFDRVCYGCGVRLQLSPEGQQQISQNPKNITVCVRCHALVTPDLNAINCQEVAMPGAFTAGSRVIPNMRRNRN